MIKTIFAILISIFIFSSCSSVSVEAGEEAVFVKKPWFFGSGGVDNDPLTQGREWCAFTTDGIKFQIIPITYTETFDDMMSDDNTPVDFSAYLKLRIISGQTPILADKFGEKWYENSVSPKFRALVRDRASSYKMFDLTSNREVLVIIEKQIFDEIALLCKTLGLPVEVMSVTIGAVTPPDEVLEETRRTAAQNQSKLTQDARANAELARKQAEVNKAIADKAYQNQMSMSIQEYLQLRQLEIEKEKVELVREKNNVTIVMGQGLQPTIPVK
jgi:regulator of protease activity HflC (stomatin/prohibitin superfamily)